MIESRSQAGHRRRMALSQSLAQSVSSLCCGAESGIKRIVVHWGSAAGVDLPRSEPEAELLLLNKSNRKRIKLSGYSFSGCDSESWPVISGNSEVKVSCGLVPRSALVSTKQDHSLVVGDPGIITRAPCWELRSASQNENDPLARVAIGGFTLHPNWRDRARLRRLKHHSND
jgi:hypothetical protein